MASSFFKAKENVIDFIRSPAFTVIIKNAIAEQMEKVSEIFLVSNNKLSNQISSLTEKLQKVEAEVQALKQLNKELVKKTLDNESGSDSETTSSETETESDYDEKENQESENRSIGIVRWFNAKEGYGFITVKDTDQEVFVHKSAIIKKNPNKPGHSLKDGETVEFHIKRSEKGNEARNVTGPGGRPVEGSLYTEYKRKNRGGQKNAYNSNNNVKQSKDSDNESRSSKSSRQAWKKRNRRPRPNKNTQQTNLTTETHPPPGGYPPYYQPQALYPNHYLPTGGTYRH